MPEISEVRIMSDFINEKSTNKKFIKAYHVAKGNIPSLFIDHEFKIKSSSRGKELKIHIDNYEIYVFMGMNGNWKFIPTSEWNNTKYVRLRFDDSDGNSLILHGGYMGPKYSVNKPFTGTKRGPDPVREYELFRENVFQNLEKSTFNKSFCEVLLNQEYFNGIGAYLTAEILGRSDFDPFLSFNSLEKKQLSEFLDLIKLCCEQSYEFGGGELRDWHNPFQKSRIDKWLKFYGNKQDCYKQRFGNRNIWIQKKYKIKNPQVD